jgi:uncharacterized repeat protein (TIGR01451 family)
MRTDASSKRRAPRLAGISVLALGALVTLLVAFSGGAGASGHDLVLAKSDSPDPVTQGSNLTYAIQVQNNAAPATGVVVTDTLPARVDFVSATPSQGTPCVRSGDTVTCNLGAMAAGATATVTIVVQPKRTGTISNTAVVASTPPDTNAANNSDTESTTVVSRGEAKGKPKVRVSCATPTHTGTAGDDVITGTDRADVIVTFGGNDQVFALGGKDLVCTGAGFDFVGGGSGGDILKGGSEADILVGKAGGDILIGKKGADTLRGKAGHDILRGKAGRDKLRGNAGNDLLNGGRGRDSCKGGKGRDVLKRCP